MSVVSTADFNVNMKYKKEEVNRSLTSKTNTIGSLYCIS